MYGYIYKTTNLINGKIYIGQHKSKDFDTDYYGSGTLLKSALKKYGKENFKCEVLERCYTKSQLEDREIYWIDRLNSCDHTIGYNISSGGFTPRFNGKNHPMWGKHHSETSKKKNRLSHLGKKLSEETKRKISDGNKGKAISEEQRVKISQANRGKIRGDRLTDDGRRRISESSKNRIVSEETRKKISSANKGRKFSEEHIKKLSESHKGKRGYWAGKQRDTITREKISKAVSSPRPYRRIQYEIDGVVFLGLVDGAKFYGITKSCMSLWIKRGLTNDKRPINIIDDNQLHRRS